jgi:hypothetical protein
MVMCDIVFTQENLHAKKSAAKNMADVGLC